MTEARKQQLDTVAKRIAKDLRKLAFHNRMTTRELVERVLKATEVNFR
jgi:hypothetical protein